VLLLLVGAVTTLFASPSRVKVPPVDSMALVYQLPPRIGSGSEIRPGFGIRAFSGGRPTADIWIKLVPTSKSVYLANDSTKSGPDGIAMFDALRVSGPAGEVQLLAVSGTIRFALPRFQLVAGPAARIIIVDEPSLKVVAGKPLAKAPRVRVEDVDGNILVKEEISVSIISDTAGARVDSPKDSTSTVMDTIMYGGGICRKVRPLGTLSGITTRPSDADGIVEFKDLTFSGRCGRYRLRFSPSRDTMNPLSVESGLLSYDAERAMDRNFVEIAAIKTLAGEVPKNEFFALRFKFRLTGPTERHPRLATFFAMSAIDVALSNRESKDSVGSKQEYLTEASFSFNWQMWKWRDEATDIPDRSTFLGAVGKVFNTIPYAGIQVGAVEMGGSPFEGSFLSAALLHSLYETPVVVEGSTVRPQPMNLYLEFHIRSATIDFFKILTIRGGVLLPFGHGVPMTSRIAIMVPLQTLQSF